MLVNVSLIIILHDISVTYDCIRLITLNNQELLYSNALVAYFKAESEGPERLQNGSLEEGCSLLTSDVPDTWSSVEENFSAWADVCACAWSARSRCLCCSGIIWTEINTCTCHEETCIPQSEPHHFAYLQAYFWLLFMTGKNFSVFQFRTLFFFIWCWWLPVEQQWFSDVELLLNYQHLLHWTSYKQTSDSYSLKAKI